MYVCVCVCVCADDIWPQYERERTEEEPEWLVNEREHFISQRYVQSNLRRKDTLGAGLLSFVRRLSLSRRFTHISITSLFNVKKNSF